MVDIHCHILPAVDDGSSALSESLEMARLAAAGGTDTVVCTPHCNVPYELRGNFRGATLNGQVDMLRQALREAEIPLQLLCGAEIMTTPELPELIRAHRLQTLADSRYLLMEFFFDEPLGFIDRMLGEVLNAGLVPVLAHPERYDAVQEMPSVLGDWFGAGIILQINKGSVLGRLGSGAEECSHWILSHGLAHVLASDAHSSVSRTPHMRELSRSLEKEIGHRYTNILLEENPRRIIEDRDILRAEQE